MDSRRTSRCSEPEPAVQLTLKSDLQWRMAPMADLYIRLPPPHGYGKAIAG